MEYLSHTRSLIILHDFDTVSDPIIDTDSDPITDTGSDLITDSALLTCLVCLRRRTRSITNDRSPGWSVLRCCHGITQGQLGVVDDLVSPAEWWASSWAAP